jgi:hypothetical protein
MPMCQKTPQQAVEEFLSKQLEEREKKLLRTFEYVGVCCVREAKLNPGYIDQTGNLRSSIGYMILKDGKVVSRSGFHQEKEGDDGVKEGKDFLRSLIANNQKGLVLIVVAGMNYAAYVETKRNVLKSSELLAEKLVPKLLRELGLKIQ